MSPPSACTFTCAGGHSRRAAVLSFRADPAPPGVRCRHGCGGAAVGRPAPQLRLPGQAGCGRVLLAGASVAGLVHRCPSHVPPSVPQCLPEQATGCTCCRSSATACSGASRATSCSGSGTRSGCRPRSMCEPAGPNKQRKGPLRRLLRGGAGGGGPFGGPGSPRCLIFVPLPLR